MSDVFLSYKSDDRETARTLAAALESEGYSVWWDREIPPGKSFDNVIKEQLDAARCVIVLWSAASVLSDWVREEAAEAARRKILVPALIDRVEIPMGFRRLQAADLVGWRADVSDPNFQLLLGSVKGLLGAAREGGGSDTVPAERPQAAPAAEQARTRKPQVRPRSVGRWIGIGLAIVLLAVFYLAIHGESCGNRDLVMILSLLSFPLSAFLIAVMRRRYRFLWIACPVVTFLAGLPYGHRYGQMSSSAIFGLEVGEKCQQSPESYALLVGFLLAAIIVDLLFFHRFSRRAIA
jgi:hypothetical protein